ncbi:MAG: RNA 2',3'-cyclic phosphodiesterase [Candidatus Omnitrophica bacterium]|nr:RNA 2',3'-cyclic phosphodiesterase [Candidatus Omnitrophota bacterium]
MPDKIRSFIAIELSKEIQGELGNLIAELKQVEGDIRWAKVENIHLTLKFLGNLSTEELDIVKRVMDKTISGVQNFTLSLGKLGGFPNFNRPRVIWVGIDKGADEVRRINGQLEDLLAKEGFEREEREFHPHLTLGRIKTRKGLSPGFRITPGWNCPCSMDVSHLTLFQSTLTPKGSIYTPLKTSSF